MLWFHLTLFLGTEQLSLQEQREHNTTASCVGVLRQLQDSVRNLDMSHKKPCFTQRVGIPFYFWGMNPPWLSGCTYTDISAAQNKNSDFWKFSALLSHAVLLLAQGVTEPLCPQTSVTQIKLRSFWFVDQIAATCNSAPSDAGSTEARKRAENTQFQCLKQQQLIHKECRHPRFARTSKHFKHYGIFFTYRKDTPKLCYSISKAKPCYLELPQLEAKSQTWQRSLLWPQASEAITNAEGPGCSSNSTTTSPGCSQAQPWGGCWNPAPAHLCLPHHWDLLLGLQPL